MQNPVSRLQKFHSLPNRSPVRDDEVPSASFGLTNLLLSTVRCMRPCARLWAARALASRAGALGNFRCRRVQSCCHRVTVRRRGKRGAACAVVGTRSMCPCVSGTSADLNALASAAKLFIHWTRNSLGVLHSIQPCGERLTAKWSLGKYLENSMQWTMLWDVLGQMTSWAPTQLVIC